MSFSDVLRWFRLYGKSDKQRIDDEKDTNSPAADWVTFYRGLVETVTHHWKSQMEWAKTCMTRQREFLNYIHTCLQPSLVNKYYSWHFAALYAKYGLMYIVYSLIHSYTHTLIHSYTHTLIRSYAHTLIHSYTHTLIHSYTHTLIH